MFPKLSKLLNQEDALSAPCLRCDFYSPQALSRGGAMLRTRLIRRFCGHITVCDHRLIALTSADVFPVVGGKRTGRARRCKAKQRRRQDGADVWILAPTVVRFLSGVQNETQRKKIFLVTWRVHYQAICSIHSRMSALD